MTWEIILGGVTLGLAVLVHAVIVSRWSARMQTVIENQQEEIKLLRSLTTEHARLIEKHEVLLQEWGQRARRSGFDRRTTDREERE